MTQLPLKPLHSRRLGLLFSLSLDRTRSFSRSVLNFCCILYTIYTSLSSLFAKQLQIFTQIMPFLRSCSIRINTTSFLRSSDFLQVMKLQWTNLTHMGYLIFLCTFTWRQRKTKRNKEKQRNLSVFHFSISFNIISLEVCWRQQGCMGSPGTLTFPVCH